MTRRTKASRRDAFLRHVALPVRYTGASTAAGQRLREALRRLALPIGAPYYPALSSRVFAVRDWTPSPVWVEHHGKPPARIEYVERAEDIEDAALGSPFIEPPFFPVAHPLP